MLCLPLEFKTKPLAHQLREFQETKAKPHWGLFWEMGCCKTKPVIDTIAYLEEMREITGAVVVSPGGVDYNWVVDELPKHLPDSLAERTRIHLWQSSKSRTGWHREAANAALTHQGFSLVCMTYSAVMTDLCAGFLNRFFKERRCMFVLDESSEIKTAKAKRTLRIQAWSKKAPYRRVLTGTPVDDKPFDVFTQVRFLNPEAWLPLGIQDPVSFRAYFGKFEKRWNYQGPKARAYEALLEYRNLRQMHEILKAHGSRYLKRDVLDLPPKQYSKRYFHMTPEQWRIYKALEEEYVAFMSSGMISAPLAITRQLRLQQVTSGYLPSDQDEDLSSLDGKNPRIDAMVELMEEAGTQQMIVWAKYHHDIDLILAAARKADMHAVRYDGTMKDSDLETAKRSFLAGDAQFWIANPAKGRWGHTLNEAKLMVYYNNSFKLNFRQQSEDRNHRYGQMDPVGIIDIVARGPSGEPTIDDYIVDCLRTKKDLASEVHGDEKLPWI